jgi:hypothetical protein
LALPGFYGRFRAFGEVWPKRSFQGAFYAQVLPQSIVDGIGIGFNLGYLVHLFQSTHHL